MPVIRLPAAMLFPMRTATLLLATATLLALQLAQEAEAAAGRRCESVVVGNTYSERYDHVDVDAILNSQRLLKAYVECIMDRGPCTKEGCFLKAVVPDALESNCSKCNDKQKVIAGKILASLLQYHRQTYWIEILNKYDPTGEFRKKYEWTDENEEDPEDN